MKVAVVTDSSCGMTNEQGKNTGILILPLQITINGENKLEGESIKMDEIYACVARKDDVKTACPPLDYIEAVFRRLKEEKYDLVFALPIGSGLSGTIDALLLAANDVGIPFDYVDCYSTFSNQLYLVQAAKDLFDDGHSLEDVKAILNKSINDSATIIVPDDLMHLARGGRLTPMAATLDGLLKIKPLLYLNKLTLGKIDTLSKVRSMQKAKKEIVDYLKKQGIDEHYLITVGHVGDDEKGKALYKLIKENFPKNEILYSQIVSAVGVHTGIGCIGLQYIRRISVE